MEALLGVNLVETQWQKIDNSNLHCKLFLRIFGITQMWPNVQHKRRLNCRRSSVPGGGARIVSRTAAAGNRTQYIHPSQCKILIVSVEGWFGQPKYSTPLKKIILRCVGLCFCSLHQPFTLSFLLGLLIFGIPLHFGSSTICYKKAMCASSRRENRNVARGTPI